MLYSTETDKRLPFYNPVSSAVETPEFTPDGRHLLFASSIDGWVQICESDIGGGNMRRISHVRAIEVSPKVNPKNPSDVLFISGRGGSEQLWRMNIDGGDMERLTPGDGYVSNPAWSPNGQFVAFAWTKGYEPGNYNIFVMDIAKRVPNQLTHGSGRNENPWWATGRRAPGVFVQARTNHATLYHAGRRQPRAAVDHPGRQHPTGVVESDKLRILEELFEKRKAQPMNTRFTDAVCSGVRSSADFFGRGMQEKAPVARSAATCFLGQSERNHHAGAHSNLAVRINSFTAEPRSIERGQSATLRWSVANATDISIDQNLGAVPANGSRQVFPSNTTTYTLTARGAGGPIRDR